MTVITNASLVDYGYACLVNAENYKLHAYSAFTLLFIHNRGTDPKVTRSMLAPMAAKTGLIAENTWQSYVKGVEVTAQRLYDNMVEEITHIRTLDLEPAVDEIRKIFEMLNIVTGGDIRDWSKTEGFEPLDKAGIAAKRKAKAAADKKAKADAALSEWLAKPLNAPAPAPAVVQDADPVAAIIAALASLTMSQRQDILGGLNDLITADIANAGKALAAAPAADPMAVAPVLADDVAPDAASTLAKHFNRKAA